MFFTLYDIDESSEVRYEVLPLVLLKVPVLCTVVLCHWVNTKVLLKVMRRLISQLSKCEQESVMCHLNL